MFNILFYIFAKKHNSTARPSTATLTTACELKAETSVINPTIIINGVQNPSVFNYAYIAEFSRYYFVQSWTYIQGRWYADLQVDVLGTYKAEIAASSQYVLRSASASDGTIEDTLYPMINAIDIQQSTVTTSRPLTSEITSGYYIVGIIAKNGSIGCVNYYIFTQSQFDTLKDALFNDISWTSVSDVSSDLLKTMFNPYDYIVSCKWVPITTLSTLVSTTDVTSIQLGWWTFTCNGKKLTGSSYSYVGWGFSIAKTNFGSHPQSGRGVYLNGGRYSEYNMNLAPYGCIHLPAESVLYGITCNEWIDIITGECILKVFAGSGGDATVAPLVCIESTMLVDIQLAQVRSDGGYMGLGIDAAASGINAIIDKFADSVVMSTLSGITSAVREQNTTVKIGGSNGGFARLAQFANFNAVITSIFHKVSDDDNSHLGRPLCKTRTISTLSGYTLCADAEIAITGTEEENRKIIQFLNNGFYYE